MKQRDPIKAQTKILWIRQSGLCFWCGLPMTRSAKLVNGSLDERRATLDHVVARGNGGEDKPENVVLRLLRLQHPAQQVCYASAA